MAETKYIPSLSSKSGFFNSKEGTHDRTYNAEDISAIFDGIIKDGVYNDYGERFFVKYKGRNTVSIGTGRAWFNNTWFVSDSAIIKQLDEPIPNPAMGRFDAIAIEVNLDPEIRATQLAYIVGDGGYDYAKPKMIKNAYVNQYPLAYIEFKPGTTDITDADIEIVVGTSECPFVTGILEHTDINDLLAKWNIEGQKIIDTNDQAFQNWFDTVKSQLDTNQAGHLQNEIDEINARLDSFGNAEDNSY